MKIYMFAFGLIATSAGLCANNWHDDDKMAQSCCVGDCCASCCSSPTPSDEATSVAFTPQWYNMGCNCGFFATAEFLYWYGQETDLSYALEGQTRNNNNSLSTTYQFSTSELNYLDAKWKPGVRIGLGLNSECDGWDLYLYWTYYYNTSSNTSSVPQFTTGYPPLNGRGLVNPWVSRPIFAGILFDEIAAQWNFRFNSLDLELGRRYWVSKCVTLRPFAAVRAAWTATEFDVRGTRQGYLGNYTTTSSDDFTSKDEFNNSFNGVGLVGGIQPTWYFSDCFSLFGSMDIALLWGKHKCNKTEHYIDNQVALLTSVVTQLADYRSHSSSDSHYMQPILDLALGLRYENYYCCDQFHVAIDLGWEHHVLFHLNDRYQISGNVMQYTTAPSTTTEGFDHYEQTDHDVSFGGLVLRVRFDF